VKLIIVIVLKIVALLFLAFAAVTAGGISTLHDNWLLVGGLATWCAASLLESLPIRETPVQGTP
jgi:hypothetical protein